MKTPDNLEVFATHGSHTYPDSLKPLIRTEFDDRLIKNYSDWATWELLQDIPEGQRLRPKHGRIAGDPNRALDAKDLFRDHVDDDYPSGITRDFNGIEIFTQPLSDELKEEGLEESYIPYHREAVNRLLTPHGNSNNRLLVIDGHDTGNELLALRRDDDGKRLIHAKGIDRFNMTPVLLSNVLKRTGGRTSSDEVLSNLQSAFKTHFGLTDRDIRINNPYKGGYFTQTYGDPKNADLQEARNPNREMVQIELGRFLYMDERKQKLDEKAVVHYREKLALILREVADGLRVA